MTYSWNLLVLTRMEMNLFSYHSCVWNVCSAQWETFCNCTSEYLKPANFLVVRMIEFPYKNTGWIFGFAMKIRVKGSSIDWWGAEGAVAAGQKVSSSRWHWSWLHSGLWTCEMFSLSSNLRAGEGFSHGPTGKCWGQGGVNHGQRAGKSLLRAVPRGGGHGKEEKPGKCWTTAPQGSLCTNRALTPQLCLTLQHQASCPQGCPCRWQLSLGCCSLHSPEHLGQKML